MMLSVRNLHSGYGPFEALHGINLSVASGEVVTVIGANGAGKTTLLMTICGNPRARTGEILFEGEDISDLPTHLLIRRGVAHVPEGRRIFPRMSVRENLMMGAFACPAHRFPPDLEFVLSLFPALKPRLSQSGGTLSGGEQQMLAVARALISRPKLLLLDEPSLGLAPLMVRRIFDTIRQLRQEHGTTILLVEQNAFQALKLADRGYVMVNGRMAREASGLELLSDPDVQSDYLEGGLSPGAMQEETPR
jgi:branched-chain amino acid transport system ATP-binding protein